MANMSYCRFENTEMDLRDCWMNMELDADASPTEEKARRRLIILAANIAEAYGEEVGLNVTVEGEEN